jgi:hypothetical protein
MREGRQIIIEMLARRDKARAVYAPVSGREMRSDGRVVWCLTVTTQLSASPVTARPSFLLLETHRRGGTISQSSTGFLYYLLLYQSRSCLTILQENLSQLSRLASCHEKGDIFLQVAPFVNNAYNVLETF